jgi:hypothetical protein
VEIKTNPEYAQKVFYDAIATLKKSIPPPHQDCGFCKWIDTGNIK